MYHPALQSQPSQNRSRRIKQVPRRLRRDAIPVFVELRECHLAHIARAPGPFAFDDLKICMTCATTSPPFEQRRDERACMAQPARRRMRDDVEQSQQFALEHRDAAGDRQRRRSTISPKTCSVRIPLSSIACNCCAAAGTSAHAAYASSHCAREISRNVGAVASGRVQCAHQHARWVHALIAARVQQQRPAAPTRRLSSA